MSGKNFYFLLLIGCFSSVLQAQQRVPLSQVLASARKDARVLAATQITQAAQNLPTHDHWLRTVEARVGINGSALGDTIYGYIRNEDSYGLILSTNAFRELKQQKKVTQAQIAQIQSEGNVFLEEAVESRYEALQSWYFAQKQLRFLQKSALLLEHRALILRTTAQAGLEVKATDLVQTERDRIRNTTQILETETKLRIAESDLLGFLDLKGALQIDTVGFISLRQISQYLLSPANHMLASRPEVQQLEKRLALEDAKIAYVNSQDRQIFQSLRLGYDRPLYLTRPNRFNTTNNLSIRVGLAVPLPGNHRFQQTQALLDKMETEWAITEKRNAAAADAELIRSRIMELLRYYEALEKQNAESIIQTYLANQELKAALKPLEINELEITAHQLDSKMAEIESEITVLYLDYVKVMGGFTAEPFVNYLSDTREGW
jgi:hypothetical protein